MRSLSISLVLLLAGVAHADSYFLAQGEVPPSLPHAPAAVQRLGKGPYFAFERQGTWYVVRDAAFVSRANAASPSPDPKERAAAAQAFAKQMIEKAQQLREAKTPEERQRLSREIGALQGQANAAFTPPKQDEAAAAQRGAALKALADEALKSGLAQKVD
jgi:hypothetical protein